MRCPLRGSVVLAAMTLLWLSCLPNDFTAPDQFEFGGDRPVWLDVPSSYDHGNPTPLLFVLHGYGANGYTQKIYTGLADLVEKEGILLVAPDGTSDQDGMPFWNATDGCCDFWSSGVDDTAYIGGLIDEIRSVYNVDFDRIYFFGHSNGGFMSYRMSCERSGDIAAMISLAGASFFDRADCAPSASVSVLQIHGSDDNTVLYDGDTSLLNHPGHPYPSASASLEHWANYHGCGSSRSEVPPALDIDSSITGDETTAERFQGCPDGVDLELWTMAGGSHLPTFAPDFADRMWAWLSAHPRHP